MAYINEVCPKCSLISSSFPNPGWDNCGMGVIEKVPRLGRAMLNFFSNLDFVFKIRENVFITSHK